MSIETAVDNDSEDFRVVTLRSRCTYHTSNEERCMCTMSWTDQKNVLLQFKKGKAYE